MLGRKFLLEVAKARPGSKNSSSAQLPLEKPELQKSLGNL